MTLCARLRERHQDVLRQKLFKLKQEQGVESEPLFPIIKEEPRSDDEWVTLLLANTKHIRFFYVLDCYIHFSLLELQLLSFTS